MCGICGIFGDASRGDLNAMVRAMRHRGPDDSGTCRGGMAALGMTRLAVIDLSPAAHQPMETPDGAIRLVYNGEMFNFRSERRLLEEQGCTFRSSSDTEIVLRMYEHYGDDFVTRLRGMFAVAIHDRRPGPGRERLLLARDPFGIKPLLYASGGGTLLFASEIKALLASGRVAPKIDPEALRLLLTTGSVPQPQTILAGVRMLSAGHRLVAVGHDYRIEPFWVPGCDRVPGILDASHAEQVAAVRTALEESVRLQMVSDVPVGAFLSGGVDSSLLVAMMSRFAGGRVKTFSVGFGTEGASLDETDAAERIARHIGTDHARVVVTGKDVRDRIVLAAAALDQPSVDGINAYFVSLAARRAVTVAISGTGGDELFGGYPWFARMAQAAATDRLHPLRSSWRGILGAAARSPLFDAAATGAGAAAVERLRGRSGFLPRFAREYRIFDVAGAAQALSPEMRERCRCGREPALDIRGDALADASPVRRVSALCLRGYTQNQLLRDIDAVAMTHSLEVRVPFLDTHIVDLALSLPDDAKLAPPAAAAAAAAATYRESGAKRILIEAGRGLLPDGIDRQQKRGFGMPFGAWLSGDLREIFEDTLSPASIRARNLFSESAASGLKARFFAGHVAWPQPWLLMMTELWCREVLDPVPWR